MYSITFFNKDCKEENEISCDFAPYGGELSIKGSGMNGRKGRVYVRFKKECEAQQALKDLVTKYPDLHSSLPKKNVNNTNITELTSDFSPPKEIPSLITEDKEYEIHISNFPVNYPQEKLVQFLSQNIFQIPSRKIKCGIHSETSCWKVWLKFSSLEVLRNVIKKINHQYIGDKNIRAFELYFEDDIPPPLIPINSLKTKKQEEYAEVMLSNFPHTTTVSELKDFLYAFKPIDIKVLKSSNDNTTNKQLYALAVFPDRYHADSAILNLNFVDFKGKCIALKRIL